MIRRAAIVAVVVADRSASSAGTTRVADRFYPQIFSCRLFNVLPVKINTLITNMNTSRPCGETLDLVLVFLAEGAYHDTILSLFKIHPHIASPLLTH